MGIFPLLLTAVAEEAPRDLMGMLLQSNAFNVLIALVVIVWLIQKFNVLSSLDAKGTAIAAELQAAEASRLAAEKQLADTKTRLAQVTSEVDAILAQAKQSADQLSSHILVGAEAEAARIIENARQRVLQEERATIQRLQAQLLGDTLNASRHQLVQRLQDPHDRRRTIEQFIDELPTLPVTSH
jgi:F-type H+-transporting ATPase subunit b